MPARRGGARAGPPPGTDRTGTMQLAMRQQKDEPGDKVPRTPPQKAEAAFDLWLQRGLHQMFDSVAREPIPEALLKLIEEDRKK
jgi:hypothetical protein